MSKNNFTPQKQSYTVKTVHKLLQSTKTKFVTMSTKQHTTIVISVVIISNLPSRLPIKGDSVCSASLFHEASENVLFPCLACSALGLLVE